MKHSFITICAVLLALVSCNRNEFNLMDHIGLCSGVGYDSLCVVNGISYIEAGVSNFLIPESSEEEFAANREIAAKSLVPILTANGFFPRDIKIVGPEADLERALKYSEVAIRRASEIGIDILVLGSSRSRSVPEGFDFDEGRAQFVTLLKSIAPIAEKYGIMVVLEPLRKQETNLLNTVREGTAICKEVGSPNICVLADFYHMACVGEDAGAILEAGDLLKHCHIAEAAGRTAPGVDGDDFTPYLQALKDINYQGRLSFECKWDDREVQFPVAMGVLREQIAKLK